jgi:hypothetical protein
MRLSRLLECISGLTSRAVTPDTVSYRGYLTATYFNTIYIQLQSEQYTLLSIRTFLYHRFFLRVIPPFTSDQTISICTTALDFIKNH